MQTPLAIPYDSNAKKQINLLLNLRANTAKPLC